MKYSGNNLKCTDYDKAINRTAKSGEKLYVIVCPDCEDESTKKIFDFEITTSRGNPYKLPVVWSFEQQNFVNKANYINGDKEYSILKSDLKTMKITNTEFKTQLSEIKNTVVPSFVNESKDLRIAGYKLPLGLLGASDKWFRLLPNFQVDKLGLIGKAEIFNEKKYANVEFVHSKRDEFELSVADLKCATQPNSSDPSKTDESCKKIELFKQIIEVKNALDDMKKVIENTGLLKLGKDGGASGKSSSTSFDAKKDGYYYSAGSLTTKYIHYFREKESSRLYQEVHEVNVELAGTKIEYQKTINFLETNPGTGLILELIKNASDIEFTAGLKLRFYFNAGINTNLLITSDRGQGADEDVYDEEVKFVGEATGGVIVKPLVSLSVAGYIGEASAGADVALGGKFVYDPLNVKFNALIKLKPIKISPKIVIKKIDGLDKDALFLIEMKPYEFMSEKVIYDSEK
jgi:hypothetical protein